ncbi:MFS transporter [Rhodococcus sp. AG1013]|uniref:MFS transporter n=1 Tax=unclassified Rhodococcus (in: high G+C Gram-positive bacteria) TaxID=192944 RepID=UPI000E2A4F60|nr:MFS transporter [Rhodococcus sp. AG1013]RDI24883.1 putative MFS family arabinose efflux permease [Rhodococcus sp. AG1013]
MRPATDLRTPPVTDPTDRATRSARRWPARHFHGLGYVLVILLVGANMPTALYGVYRTEFGFSPVTQTAIFAVYAAALVPALFFFGPLSDRIGRRPVLIAALASGLGGIAVLAFAESTAWLFVGRILQGLSVGACSAAGTAALLEHVPGHNPVRAARAATASTAAGAALGPLIAGAVAEYLPHPLVLPYTLFGLALIPGLVALLVLPTPERAEPSAASPHPPRRRLIEMPRIPRAIRSVFLLATVPAAIAWAAVGLFQSVVPSWIAEMLGMSNLLVGAATAALVMSCSVVAQLGMRGLDPLVAQRLGLGLMCAGMLGLSVVDRVPSLALLLVVTAGVGIGHGLAFTGGMQRVSTAVALHARESSGAVLAAFFTLTYVGLGVPAIAAGLLVTYQGMSTAVAEFSLVAAVSCLIALALNMIRRSDDATG